MTSSEPNELARSRKDKQLEDKPLEDKPLEKRQLDFERAHLERSLSRLDRVARLMDDQFRLPIVGYRVGLDPVIGLIPGGGDWATWVVSVYIFWQSLRLGAPTAILTRMVLNLTTDLVVGYVPILGDTFDAAFKANRKNVDMLLDFYGVKKGEQRLHFPGDLPALVDKEREKPSLLRYMAGALAVVALFVIAAVPILVLWWLVR
jgi:hypothetical protein